VAPHWFVWTEDGVYVSVERSSDTWTNAELDPRVALVIDRGRGWTDLAGVQIEGTASSMPAEHPDARRAVSAWHEKYRSTFAGDGFERFAEEVASLGFLRVQPERVTAWTHDRS